MLAGPITVAPDAEFYGKMTGHSAAAGIATPGTHRGSYARARSRTDSDVRYKPEGGGNSTVSLGRTILSTRETRHSRHPPGDQTNAGRSTLTAPSTPRGGGRRDRRERNRVERTAVENGPAGSKAMARTVNPKEIKAHKSKSFIADIAAAVTRSQMVSMTETVTGSPDHSSTIHLVGGTAASSNQRPVTPHQFRDIETIARSRSGMGRVNFVTPTKRGPPAWATPRNKDDPAPVRTASALRLMQHVPPNSRAHISYRTTSPLRSMARSPLISRQDTPSRIKDIQGASLSLRQDSHSTIRNDHSVVGGGMNSRVSSVEEDAGGPAAGRSRGVSGATGSGAVSAEIGPPATPASGPPRFGPGSQGVLAQTRASTATVITEVVHGKSRAWPFRLSSANPEAESATTATEAHRASPAKTPTAIGGQALALQLIQSPVAVNHITRTALSSEVTTVIATPRIQPSQNPVQSRETYDKRTRSGANDGGTSGEIGGSDYHPSPSISAAAPPIESTHLHGPSPRRTSNSQQQDESLRDCVAPPANRLVSQSGSVVQLFKFAEAGTNTQRARAHPPKSVTSGLEDDQLSTVGAAPSSSFLANPLLLLSRRKTSSGQLPAAPETPTTAATNTTAANYGVRALKTMIVQCGGGGPTSQLTVTGPFAGRAYPNTEAAPVGGSNRLAATLTRVVRQQPLYVHTVVHQQNSQLQTIPSPPVVTSRRVVRRSILKSPGEITKPTSELPGQRVMQPALSPIRNLSGSLHALPYSDSYLKLSHRKQSHDEAHMELLAEHVDPPLGASRANERYYDFLADDVMSLRQVIMAEAVDMPPPPAPPELLGPPPAIPSIIGFNKSPINIPANLELESKSGYIVPLPRKNTVSRKGRSQCQLC